MKPSAASSGYSGTPLAKKLGIQEGFGVLVVNAPPGYATWLEPLPPAVTLSSELRVNADLAHVFVVQQTELVAGLATLRRQLSPATPVWISWPKKASKVPTTITEDTIREAALPLGYVDVKVCAVSTVWSGLKLVVRRELR